MKKRVISLVLCLLMVLSLIPTTASASDIATQGGNQNHIDVNISMEVEVNGKKQNLNLQRTDLANLTITNSLGKTFTLNNGFTLDGTSYDKYGNQQFRLVGNFPYTTNWGREAVNYTLTLKKTIDGVPFEFAATVNIWGENNVCPGNGIDVAFGKGSQVEGVLQLTKAIGINSAALVANKEFTFTVTNKDNSSDVRTVTIKTTGTETTLSKTISLPAGEYVVKETTAASYQGYEAATVSYKVGTAEATNDNAVATITVGKTTVVTVTNTYAPTAPATTSVTVTKAWAGQNGIPEAKLPTSVTVTLLQNGNDIDRTLTLTKDGNWTGTFSGLRVKDDDGVNYVYTVVDSVPGYTTTPGNADNNYTVTNTANWITPEVKSLPDLKIAKVDGKGDVITTGSATFELKKDGESTGKTITTSNGYGTFADLEEGTYTLTETVAPGGYVKSNTVWTIKVEEVSRTVEEVMANGVVTGYRTRITYGVTVTADGTTAIGPMDGAYPFTNTAISKFDIPVKKVWTGDEDFTALRPESITVRLYKVVNDESVPTGMSLTLSAANNWNGSFTGLDATDSDGNSIAYTVKEDTVPGYTSLLSGDKDGFTINNTLDTGSLKITKVLDGITASENMTFTVKIEGTVNGKAITKNVPITVEQGKTSGTVDVTLPSGDYTVTEIEPITKTVGYYEWTGVSYAYQNISVNRVNSAEADTVAKVGAAKHPVVIVTNTYEETYTDITVTKQWANVKDSDNVAQYEINVKLLADGKETGKILTLTKAGNWTGKFENLDIKDKDGKVITYTVVETNVPDDYTATVGTKENKYTITNTHDYVVNIPFTKEVTKGLSSNNPGKTTFTFVAYYMDGDKAVNVGIATIETNGVGTYKGLIKGQIPADLVNDDVFELKLAEVKGTDTSWTYSDAVYDVRISNIAGDKPTVMINKGQVENTAAIFTNKYSYTYTPTPKPNPRPTPKPVPSAKTGDMGIALYALTSLLSLSGTALVIKKRKDEE
mgnify:CR=1 FL=1